MTRAFSSFILICSSQLTLAADLTLKIAPYPDARHWDYVIATFTNESDSTIRLLKKMDGSSRNLIYPHYDLSVSDPNGKPLTLKMPGCGMIWFWSGMKWPEDYIIELAPGKSFELPIGILHQIPETAKYAVSLTYKFTPAKGEKIFNEPYPPDLWVGTITSEPLNMELEERTLKRGGAGQAAGVRNSRSKGQAKPKSEPAEFSQ